MQSLNVPCVHLVVFSRNFLSLSFQLAFPDFTSFPSGSLSALLVLSTASRMRKPPRSVRARRTTPGHRQTHHLPPAHVRLAEAAAFCTARKGGCSHGVCPSAQSRAAVRAALRGCPLPACCAGPWGLHLGTRVLGRARLHQGAAAVGGDGGASLRHRTCRLQSCERGMWSGCSLPVETRARSFSQYSSQILIKWPLVNWIGLPLLQ